MSCTKFSGLHICLVIPDCNRKDIERKKSAKSNTQSYLLGCLMWIQAFFFGIGLYKTACFPAYLHKCTLIVKGKSKQTIKILKNISGMHPNPDVFLLQVFMVSICACRGGNFRPWKRFAVSDHCCSKR